MTPLSAGKNMEIINFHFRTNSIKEPIKDFLKIVDIKIKYKNIYKEKKVYKDSII